MKTRLSIEEFNKNIPKESRLILISYINDTVCFGETKRTAGKFKCRCGKFVTLPVTYVIRGRQKSCNCILFESEKNRKYNSYNPYLRRVYYAMLDRCHNPKDKGFRYYGAIGIRVCDEWRQDGQKFFDWAISNGWKKGLQLDKDILCKKLNISPAIYSPTTCLFVTRAENIDVTSHTIKIHYKGKLQSLAKLVKDIGCSYAFVTPRMKRGLNGDEIRKEYLNHKNKLCTSSTK